MSTPMENIMHFKTESTEWLQTIMKNHHQGLFEVQTVQFKPLSQ